MVGLIFIIALLNISLGFLLALHLGFGPPDWRETYRKRAGRLPGIYFFRSFGQITTPIPELLSDASMQASPSGYEAPENSPPPTPIEESIAAEVEPAASEATRFWNFEEKYVETSILRLNLAMVKSDQRSSAIDARLRACQEHTDLETIETCLRLLREDCTTFLAEQGEATDNLHQRLSELGTHSNLGEKIERENLEQVAQVETTLNNLGYMDFQSDREAANLRLREEIKNLRLARHRLRDDHESAFLMIARSEKRIEHIEERLFTDPLLQIDNRIGIEVKLSDWWRRKQHQTRPICGMFFDIDAFSLSNEHHGPRQCDSILCQLANLFRESVEKNDLVGRYSGQQFLWIALDVGPQAALRKAEFLRQSIENLHFLHSEQTLQITMRCAVTEVKPEEDYPAFLGRLEESLPKKSPDAANRTFFHNGNKCEPVNPINLKVEEREIAI